METYDFPTKKVVAEFAGANLHRTYASHYYSRNLERKRSYQVEYYKLHSKPKKLYACVNCLILFGGYVQAQAHGRILDHAIDWSEMLGR